MNGGPVCMAHGGAAPQVRAAAAQRLTVANFHRAYAAAQKRFEAEYAEWQARRVATAAGLLGLKVSDLVNRNGVNELLIAWCRAVHGKPAGPETAPRLRLDGRFRV